MIGLQARRLAGFDEAIEVGGGLDTGDDIAKESVAAAHTERAHCVLGRVVIDRDTPSVRYTTCVPFVRKIGQSRAQGGLRRDAGTMDGK